MADDTTSNAKEIKQLEAKYNGFRLRPEMNVMCATNSQFIRFSYRLFFHLIQFSHFDTFAERVR